MMMKIFSSLVILLLLAAPCSAQSLSQIDFDGRLGGEASDEPGAKPEAKLIVPEQRGETEQSAHQIITSMQDLKSDVEITHSVELSQQALLDAAAKRAAPRARLKPVSWPKDVVGNQFITPSLKGVISDDKQRFQSWVTSKNSWKKKPGKSCGEPLNEAEMVSKSLAIREVLFRFSGNDEFASGQCQAECKTEGYSHQLAGVSFNNLKGGSFKFVDEKGECRYRLARHPKKKWQVLQPTRVSCVCLPQQ